MANKTYEYPGEIYFEDAAKEVLLAGFGKMVSNLDRTRSGLQKSVATPDEIEALHDMRVGSRRMRAGLEVFGKLFSKSELRRLNREMGDVTGALGAVRDLDVQLDAMRTLAATVPPNEAYGVEQLINRQSERRDRERKALLAELDRLDKSRFRRRVKRLIKNAVSDSVLESRTRERKRAT